MGVLGRMPIALAPGMGLNAYFTYSVVLGHGMPWQTALGAVFVSGVIFLVLTMSGIREAVINAIPLSIKRASAAGIGMFLALIGLQAGGIVAANPVTMIGLGDMTSATAILALLGVFLTGSLLLRRVPGAILIGIVTVSTVAIVFRLPVFSGQEFPGFSDGIVSWPVWPRDLFGAFNVREALEFKSFPVVFTFLFVAFFDTAGTLMGLSEVARMTDKDGHIPNAGRAFAADAIATTAGAVIGTSTTTAYMESAAGIEDGGKSGLVAVTVGLLFLLSLFLWPVAGAVPAVATAPALIILGAMLMETIGKIQWTELRESLPAFLTIIVMPMTFSIANGISIGILTYVAISLFAKKANEVHPVMYGLSVILVARFFWG
jgi:AGZA family xanthine/uracil permease-like MFS transporter